MTSLRSVFAGIFVSLLLFSSLSGEEKQEIIIVGAANNPGPHPFIEGRGALEHLHDAGGAREICGGGKIVVNLKGNDGEFSTFHINSKKLISESKDDFEISAGSIISLPQGFCPDATEYNKNLAEYVKNLRKKRAKEKEE